MKGGEFKKDVSRLNSNRNSKKLLKKRILIPTAILKESTFYADFKYMNSIKFSLTRQRLQDWENFPDFRKKEETLLKSQVILMKITQSDLVYHKTLLYRFQAPICKNVEFSFFARRKIMDACLFVVFFIRSDHINPVVLEYRKRAHSNGN